MFFSLSLYFQFSFLTYLMITYDFLWFLKITNNLYTDYLSRFTVWRDPYSLWAPSPSPIIIIITHYPFSSLPIFTFSTLRRWKLHTRPNDFLVVVIEFFCLLHTIYLVYFYIHIIQSTHNFPYIIFYLNLLLLIFLPSIYFAIIALSTIFVKFTFILNTKS